jgi:hypothetical protein
MWFTENRETLIKHLNMHVLDLDGRSSFADLSWLIINKSLSHGEVLSNLIVLPVMLARRAARMVTKSVKKMMIKQSTNLPFDSPS